MRAITTNHEAVLSSTAACRSEHINVWVRDSGGTWRSLSTYAGVNLIDSVRWGEDSPDNPHMTASISLRRDHGLMSLAPLRSGSALNRGFVPSASYSPLLAIGRDVQIEVGIGAAGHVPAYADWLVAFGGRIDTIDSGGDVIQIECRDFAGRLADAWFETERLYAAASVSGSPVSMRIWQPSTAYVVGEYVYGSGKGNGHFHKCTTAGTSASSGNEPTWRTSAGTVTDSSIVWTYQAACVDTGFSVESVMQKMCDDVLGSGAVTISTPSSPGFPLAPFMQSREQLWPKLRTLALMFGGDLRFKWDGSAFVPTVCVYDRSTTTALRTFGSEEWKDIPKLSMDIQGIRNVVDLIYSDKQATRLADGTWPRKKSTVTNSSSVAKYGRLWMEIAEDSSTSQIDTTGEADNMAAAALADLCEPTVDQSMVLVHGFPFVELGDLYAFDPDDRHYDEQQKLAVYGYSHLYEKGSLRTTINCRGKPSAGRDRWHEASTAVQSRSRDRMRSRVIFNGIGPMTFTATPVLSGVRLQVTMSPRKGRQQEEFEFHISASSGFAVTASTIQAAGRSTACTITNLWPGETYYAKVVPCIREGDILVRGEPSSEVSFVTLRAQAGNISSAIDFTRRPLNGSFETQTNPATFLPDYWHDIKADAPIEFGDAGVLTASVASGESISGGTQRLVIQANPTVSFAPFFSGSMPWGGAVSALTPLSEFSVSTISTWVKELTTLHGDTSYMMIVACYDATAIETSLSTGYLGLAATTNPGVTLGPSSWGRLSSPVASIPSGTKFCRCGVVIGAGGSADTWQQVAVDGIELSDQSPSEAWIAPTLLNSWANYGGTDAECGYYKDASTGRVFLRGTIKNGTVTAHTNLFLLPVGYRPPSDLVIPAASSGAAAAIEIMATGYVRTSYGVSATWLSMSGLSFITT